MSIITHKKIIFAFILPFVFWIYLAFSSHMTIAFDSIGFENNGRILKSEGLRGYLKNGPQKEPLYAYSISLSMKLADRLHVDYRKVQTCLQILLLFLGQILLYRVLLLLKLNETVTTIALLYYGFSPGLISCGFDLYSEIATLPFILLSVLLISKTWHFLLLEDIKPLALHALLFSLTATVAVFSKAVLLILYPIFTFPFIIILVLSFVKRKKKQAQCAIIFLIIFFTIFNTTTNGYKSLNKKHHGYYTFADNRGVSMLYTLAFKRTAPLTKEHLSIALSSIPGQNVCRPFHGQAVCDDWFYNSGYLESQKRNELLSNKISQEKIDRILTFSSMKQALSNPFQYSLFYFLESLKMFFWESTKIGFVIYPQWLTNIHDNILVKNTLRLLMALITLFSIVYVGVYMLKNHRKIYDAQDQKHQCLFFLFFFLMLFIGLYSLAMTLTRYSLPIAPLFIAAIASALNEKFSKFLR